MFDGENFTITATCASGVEKVLKSELKRLGYGEPPVVNGACSFTGKIADAVRCNMFLRTADRVYLTLKKFTAETFDQLFDGVKSIEWENFIPSDGRVIVDGKCVKSKIFAISASQGIVKKAIVNRLTEKYKTDYLPEDGALYAVDFYLYNDEAEIRLNTSGEGLHKRGYRDMVGVAPIKETLASAMLLLSDFYYKRPFIDPFCGSGTFVIEGARIALDIAPGINREFAFNRWLNFDKKIYPIVREEALDNEKRDRKIDFCGFDIDPKAIKIAERHAERAGVKDSVSFMRADVKDLVIDKPYGTIVTNPPYGERVYDRRQAEGCYYNLGERLRGKYGWSAFVITSSRVFEQCFGRKADRTRKLFNSEKECNYYYYYGKREPRAIMEENENDSD